MTTRIATEDVYAEVPEEAGPIERLVAKAGHPVPAIYDDLVGEDQATTDQSARTSAVPTVGPRERSAGTQHEPQHGYGPTAEANAKARAAAGGGSGDAEGVQAVLAGLDGIKERLEQTEAKLAEAEQAREDAEAARAEAEASKETAESEARELVKRVEALEEAAEAGDAGDGGDGGSAPAAGGKPKGRAR